MRCERIAAVVALAFPVAARGDDLRVVTGAVLYESGLAAPAVELRSADEAGRLWRASITGWTISASRELPTERGRRLVFTVDATPYDAHSSRRIFTGGVRDRAAEFDDAAFDVRGGMRIRENERATIEGSVVAGKDIVGSNAPAAIRDRWRSPFAGMAVVQRLRFVTADDPLRGRIDGVELAATGELFAAKRGWAKLMLTESGGLEAGRVHLRESVAAFDGSGLDTLNAFLIGGSWDVLGPAAVYGRPYAELRLPRGVVVNGGADLDLEPLTVGVRASAVHASSREITGVMLQLSEHLGGVRVTAGIGRSDGRSTFTASAGGALFR